MDTASLDSKSLNAHVGDHIWSSIDHEDNPFIYTYASSNPSNSCGSLTSGSLTPQSSVSASSSRRQSVVCSAVRTMSSFETSAGPTGFRKSKTPVASQDQYLALQSIANNRYTCSTHDVSPASRELENMFIMDTETSMVSGRLQNAFGLDGGADSQTPSFTSYEDLDNRSQGLLGSLGCDYMDDRFSGNLHMAKQYTYQEIATAANYPNTQTDIPTPMTVIPAQTTYQVPRSAYSVPQTPPRVLGDPFISPMKTSFADSGSDEVQSNVDISEDVDLYADASDDGQDTEWLQDSPTKSEHSDQCKSIITQATTGSPYSENPLLVARRRPYKKNLGGAKLAETNRRRAAKQLTCTIKKESVSRHACPICKARPGEARQFQRPEHLNRHLASVHGNEDEKVPCVVPNCLTRILKRPDNMKSHYRNTHMYGPEQIKGKKRIWLSIEAARQLGLGDIDPRTNPQSGKSRSKATA